MIHCRTYGFVPPRFVNDTGLVSPLTSHPESRSLPPSLSLFCISPPHCPLPFPWISTRNRSLEPWTCVHCMLARFNDLIDSRQDFRDKCKKKMSKVWFHRSSSAKLLLKNFLIPESFKTFSFLLFHLVVIPWIRFHACLPRYGSNRALDS